MIEREGDFWHVSEWTERTGPVPVAALSPDRNKVRVWMQAREHAQRNGLKITNAPWTDGAPGYSAFERRSSPRNRWGF